MDLPGFHGPSVPVPVIDMAVSLRDLSSLKEERTPGFCTV